MDTSEPCYLYGFVPTDADLGDLPEGLDDREVRRIEGPSLAAVASPISIDGKIRPRRRHIRAHQQVLDHVFETSDLLPASFGTVSRSADAVHDMLDEHAGVLEEELQLVQNGEEWRLTVVVDRDDAFERFVERYDELREARDRLYADGREPSRQEKIELGQQFERLLEDEREQTIDELSAHLEPASRRVDVEDPRSENSLARVACLVDRSDSDAFEDQVHEAAEAFADDLVFELTGPDIPYSFVEIELQLEQAA